MNLKPLTFDNLALRFFCRTLSYGRLSADHPVILPAGSASPKSVFGLLLLAAERFGIPCLRS